MSDKPDLPVKDAVPDGKADALPKAKELTFSQQLFIWTMIIVVGVLFGMGASVNMLEQSERKVAGVSEGEVMIRKELAENLEAVLNPNGDPRYPLYEESRYGGRWGQEVNVFEEYARKLRLAREAEAQGLMPAGAALDRIEAEFLAKPLPGSPNRSHHDALVEHEGGRKGVARDKLRLFLAERAAREALSARNVITPAVPLTVAPEVASWGDSADVVEVVLSAKALLPAVPADDPEIQTTYDRLRSTQFSRPGAASVTAAVADRAALAAAITVSDEDAKAWYEGHKAEFPGEADAKDPKATPPPKPFEAVKAQIIERLRNERAEAQGQKLADALNQIVDETLIDGEKDPARFKAAAEKSGLKLETVVVEEHRGGQLDFGRLGKVNDLVRLFNREHDIGFVSRPFKTDAGTWLVIRLDARREPGFKDLAEVKPQVLAHLAGRRAWKRLQEEAGKAREAASKTGLKAWSESDAGKAWGSTATTANRRLFTPLTPPAGEADGPAGDPVLVASLTMPDHPVALVAEPWDGDVPRVRLVQVSALKPAPVDPARAVGSADAYRNLLRTYREDAYYRDLQAKLESKK